MMIVGKTYRVSLPGLKLGAGRQDGAATPLTQRWWGLTCRSAHLSAFAP
jgi:hypothetical protein